MATVRCATLQPASGGFGEWSWTEAVTLDGCEDLMDYRSMLADNDADGEEFDGLSGRIHDERGKVYRFSEGVDPDGNPIYHYEMVWVED